MREFQARKKQNTAFSRMISSPLFLLVLLILLVLSLKGIWRVYANYTGAKDELRHLQSEFDKAKKREAELDANMQKLGSPEGTDYEIRKRLDVAKPDEKVIHIIDTSENKPEEESRE